MMKGEQMTSGPVEPGQIRVGDAQREQMAQRLQRAHANGQLDLEEYDTRVQRAYQARVQNDLDVLVLDLPDEVIKPATKWTSGAGQAADTRLTDARERALRAQKAGKGPLGRAPGSGGRSADRTGNRGGVMQILLIVVGVLVALAVVGAVVGVVLRLVIPVLVIAGIIAIVRALRDS